MKIALIGYGKMGKAIETIAVGKGHEIVLKIGIENIDDFTIEAVQQADIAIEFSSPHGLSRRFLARHRIPPSGYHVSLKFRGR